MASGYGTEAALALIDELIATGNWLDGLTMHLAKVGPPFGRGVVLADFTESDFAGYASHVLGAWGTPYIDTADNVIVAAPSHQFSCSAPASQNVVAVYFTEVVSGSPVLRWFDILDSPVPISRHGDAVIVIAQFGLPDVPRCIVAGP